MRQYLLGHFAQTLLGTRDPVEIRDMWSGENYEQLADPNGVGENLWNVEWTVKRQLAGVLWETIAYGGSHGPVFYVIIKNFCNDRVYLFVGTRFAQPCWENNLKRSSLKSKICGLEKTLKYWSSFYRGQVDTCLLVLDNNIQLGIILPSSMVFFLDKYYLHL